MKITEAKLVTTEGVVFRKNEKTLEHYITFEDKSGQRMRFTLTPEDMMVIVKNLVEMSS